MLREILILLGIMLVGFAGIAGHWLNRWQQGRTQNGFLEYMKEYKWNSLASLSANLGASFTVYASIPPDILPKQLILTLIGLYTAGYALDSKINKEAPQTTPDQRKSPRLSPVQRSTKEIYDESNDASLGTVMDNDNTY
jgi:hypothetical protein